MKIKEGDWVLITGARLVQQWKYDEMYPQGRFGKVISVEKRFSPFDGKRLPDKIKVRVYVKGKKYHSEPESKYIIKYEVR